MYATGFSRGPKLAELAIFICGRYMISELVRDLYFMKSTMFSFPEIITLEACTKIVTKSVPWGHTTVIFK